MADDEVTEGEEVEHDEWGRPVFQDNWDYIADPNYYTRPRQYAKENVGLGEFFANLIRVFILFVKGDDRAPMFAQAWGLGGDSWNSMMNAFSAGTAAHQGGATFTGSMDAMLRSLCENDAAGLLSIIRDVEGAGSYNIANGMRTVNFTSMTIAQVKNWQNTTDHPVINGVQTSPAAGAYQIMPGTMATAIEYANKDGGPLITDSTVFDEATQDRLARGLLRFRGIDEFRNGTMSATQFMQNLSDEWAAIPGANGLSSYHGIQGNRAISPEDFQSRARDAVKPADRRSSSLTDTLKNAADPGGAITGTPQEVFASNATDAAGTYGKPRVGAENPQITPDPTAAPHV